VQGASFAQGCAGRFAARQAYSPFGWNESCEALQPFSDIVQGSRWVWGWEPTFPAGTVSPRGWCTVWQQYTSDFGYFTGPAPIAVDGGSGRLMLNVNTGLSGPGSWEYNHSQLIEDGVYDGTPRPYIIEVGYSAQHDGFITISRPDGTVLVNLQGIPTLRFNPAHNGGAPDPIGQLKLGVYRQSWCKHDANGNIFTQPGAIHTPGTCALGAEGSQPDTIVYHSGACRGDTFDVVAAHLDGASA
jgi:hypothetical protein